MKDDQVSESEFGPNIQLLAPMVAEQCATVDAKETPGTIKAGTIPIKEGALLPKARRLESEPDVFLHGRWNHSRIAEGTGRQSKYGSEGS